MPRLASPSTSFVSSAIASSRAPRERFSGIRTIHPLPVYYFPDNPWLPPESSLPALPLSSVPNSNPFLKNPDLLPLISAFSMKKSLQAPSPKREANRPSSSRSKRAASTVPTLFSSLGPQLSPKQISPLPGAAGHSSLTSAAPSALMLNPSSGTPISSRCVLQLT